MHTTREMMLKELKAIVVPALRARGFKGSFPDFFRDTGGFVALVNVQFLSSGGSFCVNLGYADAARKNVYFQPETEPAKLKISQTSDRLRLGAMGNGDHWFSFGPTSYDEVRGDPAPPDQIAARVVALLASQAEAWWAAKQEQS
jgi:hypothetical protein